MTNASPNPDALPGNASRAEAPVARGRLKIFFGACAGVGKTFAMLAAARRLRAQGVDAVIGVVQPHGRPELQALASDFEQLPLRPVEHRDQAAAEFDLGAALARQPALLLVDELAHVNAAGARHPQRWQDVEDLLAAGIDVWTTLGVQHLQTLNEVVNRITGIRVWETVPDRMFDEAEEVVMVDLPPDQLLQRLKEGKVHLPQQPAVAVRRFFRKGNLIALRDMALRRLAQREAVAGRSARPGAAAAMQPGDLDATADRRAPGEPGSETAPTAADDTTPVRWSWQPYALSLGACALATLLLAPLHGRLDLTNIAMLFLLAVVLIALRLGRGPAVLAAFVSVGAFDFFFVPPRFAFGVDGAQYVLTFAVMLTVGLVIGQLTAGLKLQARASLQRERRVRALYKMSRDLSGALIVEQVAEIGARFLAAEFGARATVYVADLDGRLLPPMPLPRAPQELQARIAQQAFDSGEPTSPARSTAPAAPILYLPLKAPMRVRGVLAVEPREPADLTAPDQRRVLDTCASLLAISLERIHYVDVAQSTTVQMESERLRNSLLAAISHDLRTPLAALVGMADSLALPQAEPRQAEIASSIRHAAMRMNSQVNNLLDMARLQSGRVQLNRQWLPLEEVVGSALRSLEGSLPPERVQVRLPPDLPLLQVDPPLFERVLCNLLENACKYTPPGSPIEIGAEEAGELIRILVDDRGPGLPRHREAAIFQMFERGHREGTTPGVGLGLAICRAIVEAHGGTVRGETRAGGGARFMIELPRGAPPALDALEPDEAFGGAA